jgi:hypothetical protein
MGNVPAAVAEGTRRATGATTLSATEHPSPVLILSHLAGRTRSLLPAPGARPYTLAGVRRSKLLCRRLCRCLDCGQVRIDKEYV